MLLLYQRFLLLTKKHFNNTNKLTINKYLKMNKKENFNTFKL